MKETKREIKYIIRRILIGVGITLLLFNLKKCNVYALDRYSYVLPQRSGIIQLYNTEQNSIYIPSVGTKSTINNLNVVNSALAEDTTIHFGTDSTAGTYSTSSNPLLHFIYNNEFEVFIQIFLNPTGTAYTKLSTGNYSLLYINDGSIVNGSSDYLALYVVPTADIGTPISQISDKTKITGSSNITYISMDSAISNSNCPLPNTSGICNNIYTATSTDANGDTIYFGNQVNSSSYIHESLFDYTKMQILDNRNNWYAYDGQTFEPNTDPLANYTKVDLTGHQAILVVPKNYSYLASEYGFDSDEPNANNPQIHYNIGYEKCVKPTLIEVNNLKNFSINTTLNSDPTSEYELNSYCADEPTLYTQNYPIQNIRSETQPAYFYMAILVYNNSKEYAENSPNWIETQQNPYGLAYVYVEEEYYNYYLVDDFSTFSQTLSYTDFNLENQTTNIDSLPTFNGLIDGSLSSVDTQWGQQMNYQHFLDFVKFPFNYLKSFLLGTCEPITLPLPYLGNMQLPCMSTIYSQHISSSLINLLTAIINGLIFWRCTLVNIVALQDILQPEDTELEVWNL